MKKFLIFGLTLVLAFCLLVPTKIANAQENEADKAGLEESIANAEAIIDEEDLYESGIEELKTALVNGIVVRDNPDATQEEVDNAKVFWI